MIARFLFTAAHALFWAATDARDIRNGKNINHPVRWALRAAIEVGASLVFAFIREEPIGIRLVLTTIAAAFLFSALFRFLLNTMRGRHWAYVSPSSWYDWFFMQLCVLRALQTRRHYLVDSFGRYTQFPYYRQHVHRAGALAYIFEAVVFGTFAYLSAVL